MRQKLIYTNQTIRIYARVRDVDGNLADPQVIEFEFKQPNDTESTTYSIGAIKKQATGVYYIDLEIVQPGKHKYTWVTDGALKSSYKSFFDALDHDWVR
jgi:hypothetical protein